MDPIFDAATADDSQILNPDPTTSLAGQQAVPLPDPTPLTASLPRLPMPAIPPLPQHPLATDPKAKIAALIAMAVAAATGPRSGLGAGLMSGVLTQTNQQHQMDLQNWQVREQQAKQQQAQIARQQATLDAQNNLKVQQTFQNLRHDLESVGSEDDYKRIIGLYAGGLQAAGFSRVTPQMLMQQFPYQPPDEQKTIQKKLQELYASPQFKSLPPDKQAASAITYTRNGVPVHLTIPEANQRLGLDMPVQFGPSALWSSFGKTPEQQGYLNQALQDFKLTNGHDADPNNKVEFEKVLADAKAKADKKDPAIEEMNRTLKSLQVQTAAQNLTAAKEKNVTPTIQPNTPEYRAAQDLAYGRLTFGQFRTLSAYSRDTNKKFAIYDKARELNPDFNPAEFEAGFKLASSPKVRQQLASLDNVQEATPDLIAVSNQAARSGVTALNGMINRGGYQIGGKHYSNFRIAVTAYADELSGALGYGSATDMSRDMGFNMTDQNLSPENFASAMQDIVVPFIERKRNTLLKQMGPYGQSNPSNDQGWTDLGNGVSVRKK